MGVLGELEVALIDGPASAVIGAPDTAGRPVIARVWGARVQPDGTTVRLLVGPPTDPGVTALRPGVLAAVTFSSCIDLTSRQLKGAVVEVGHGQAGDQELHDAYGDAFATINVPNGVPADITRRMAPAAWVAVTMQVHGVDDSHVAVSNQFLGKTQRNVLEHPYLSALVLDPDTGSQYVLDLEFIRAETSGPLFDELSDSIDAIASVLGMQAVFRLRSADVYVVSGLRELADA